MRSHTGGQQPRGNPGESPWIPVFFFYWVAVQETSLLRLMLQRLAPDNLQALISFLSSMPRTLAFSVGASAMATLLRPSPDRSLLAILQRGGIPNDWIRRIVAADAEQREHDEEGSWGVVFTEDARERGTQKILSLVV